MKNCCLLFALSFLFGTPAGADTPPRYKLTVLPLDFFGDNMIDIDSPQGGINNQGQIVGSVSVRVGRIESSRSALWQRGRPLRRLDKRPVTQKDAEADRDFLCPTAINNFGMTTGTGTLSYSGAYSVNISTAYLLWNGRIHALDDGFLPKSAQMASAALGLNDHGDIVGGYEYDNTDADQASNPAPPGTENRHAFLRRDGHTLRLWPGAARGINNHGWIVGVKDIDYDNDRSVGILWRNHHMTLFKMQPAAINNRGEIAGNIPLGDDHSKACLWRQGKITHLSAQESHAYALNNQGDVVGEQDGSAETHFNHATLWKDGRTYDLAHCVSLPRGWVLTSALGINDHGWIIGSGNIYKSPKNKQAVKAFTFLLTPQ